MDQKHCIKQSCVTTTETFPNLNYTNKKYLRITL